MLTKNPPTKFHITTRYLLSSCNPDIPRNKHSQFERTYVKLNKVSPWDQLQITETLKAVFFLSLKASKRYNIIHTERSITLSHCDHKLQPHFCTFNSFFTSITSFRFRMRLIPKFSASRKSLCSALLTFTVMRILAMSKISCFNLL